MNCTVKRVDAFTQTPGQGNPAGVVLNGDEYSEEQMQKIAKAVDFNETVFVCRSETADVRLRYFTPGYQTPLCGHATMGAIFALYEGKGTRELTIETGAGNLTVTYQEEGHNITMRQAPAKFISFNGDKAALCASLGIELTDLHQTLPIEYGNTGSWTLLLPVKEAVVLDKMSAHSDQFPAVLTELTSASIHPFAVISQSTGTFTARHFSSPFSGTTEDSVTGTASGVMGAYALNHLYPTTSKKTIIVTQGKHLQRVGKVSVAARRAVNGRHDISITGTACMNGELNVSIN
ncbi:PhzF family phenazine biosynthesis isomerase [Erwinia sp. CPCC 100877]|nr:PhzF family phenazine biosynthesis isomerase [Erwinia sp. CPCC 100877]